MVNNLKENFIKDGYVIIKNFINENEINKIYKELDIILNYIEPTFNESNLTLDEKYMEIKKKKDTLRSNAYNLITKLLSLNSIWNNNNIHNILSEILNDIYFIDGIQLRIDTPENDRCLPFHQERGQISTNEITGWLPLIDITENTGGVQIIENTHNLGDLPIIQYENGTGVEQKYITNSKKIIIKKGDLLLFHSNLIHSSFLNITDKIRWVSVARFNPLNKIPYLLDENTDLHIKKNIIK